MSNSFFTVPFFLALKLHVKVAEIKFYYHIFQNELFL